MTKWWSVAAALCVLACGGPERSSAERAESVPAKAASGEALRESPQALTPTRIDTLRDEQGEHFSPQYTTLALTRAGNTIAFDQDDKRLILFDTTGRQLAVAGRKGAGPGEFRFLNGIFVLPGDSIAIWDAGLRRMSYFNAALKFDRSENFERWGYNAEPIGRLADGRWVARTTVHGPFTDALGARRLVDTTTLVVGTSAATPVEFYRLRLRDVIQFSKGNTTHEFRLQVLNAGVGAVCERGAVLVDAGGVRLLDSTGRVVHVSSLPRTGDTIRSAAERKEIVNNQVPERLELGDAKGQIVKLLEPLASGFKVRMRQPAIDADGQLWYGRTVPNQAPRSTADQVDSAGLAIVSVPLGWFLTTDVRFSGNSVAFLNHGSDTTGLTVSVSRYPVKLTGNAERRLGRCAASFEY